MLLLQVDILISDSIYKYLDEKNDVLAIFLDLTKAFNKVWHASVV